MPNQNDSTQNPGNPPVVQPTGTTPNPVISPQSDLPPLPPAFQNLGSEEKPVVTETALPPSDTGSAAPPDISSAIQKPKKKFGGGKIIATILGLMVLIGGVGAGIVLTQEPQLFQQKAAQCNSQCTTNSQCGAGQHCNSNSNGCNTCVPNSTQPPSQPTQPPSQPTPEPGPGCSNNLCDTQSCCSAYTCTSEPDGHKHCITPPSPSPTPEPGPGCSNNLCDTQSCCSSYTCTSEPDGHKHCIGSTCSNGVTCSNPSDCHCTGGDLCTGVVCDPTIHQQCLNQGRAWCTNMTGKGMTCCAVGYVCAKGVNGCVPGTSTPTPTPTPGNHTPTPTPTIPPAAPYCESVSAYDTSGKALTNAQLSALTPGATISFCVRGIAASGTFDKAQFTIDGKQLAETTNRNSRGDFCQSYTILPTDSTVTVTAKIHHLPDNQWY
jgi:hypothetical protein